MNKIRQACVHTGFRSEYFSTKQGLRNFETTRSRSAEYQARLSKKNLTASEW